jgi:predicted transcriptional regulator
MKTKNPTDFDKFEASLLKRPGVRQEYEALKPRYEMIRTLVNRRNQLKISQSELAEIVGTKQPAISRLEKGDYNTTLKTFFKVAEALNLEISYKAKK